MCQNMFYFHAVLFLPAGTPTLSFVGSDALEQPPSAKQRLHGKDLTSQKLVEVRLFTKVSKFFDYMIQ